MNDNMASVPMKPSFFWIATIYILIGFSSVNAVFAQAVKKDSLNIILASSVNDSNKVKALHRMAKGLIQQDLSKAKEYVAAAVVLSKKLAINQDTTALKNLAYSYHLEGLIAYYGGNYPEALNRYTESLNLRKKISDKKGMAASYNNIAIIYKNQGRYQEAIKNNFESLKIEEQMGNTQAAGLSYNNIGIIYEEQNQFKEAITNYVMAIKLGKRVNDLEGIANAYNNLGIVYKKQGNYPQALENYILALQLRKIVGYPKGILGSYNNIASLYFAQGKYEEALQNNLMALNIAKNNNHELGVAMSSINLGMVYTKQKKFGLAEEFLNEGIRYSKSMDNKQSMMEGYHALTALYTQKKEYKKALDYFHLYAQVKDSLLNDDTKREIMKSALQYEFEKKSAIDQVEQEKKEAIQKEELQKRDVQIKLYITLCVLIGMLFIGVFLQMRNRRKTEKLRLENHVIDLEQKALRLQMNPHFIFNALNSIQGFITENDRVSAKKYLTKFARLMRLIMENSSQRTVSLTSELEMLTDYLELTALRFSNKFTFTVNVEDRIDTSNTEIPPMLLQPFVENAVLHGMASKEADGLIQLSFRQKKDRMECVIEDNGIGRQMAMEQKSQSHKSTGMMVTEERLKLFSETAQEKATLQVIDLFDTFGKPSGTKVILEIPLQLTWN